MTEFESSAYFFPRICSLFCTILLSYLYSSKLYLIVDKILLSFVINFKSDVNFTGNLYFLFQTYFYWFLTFIQNNLKL